MAKSKKRSLIRKISKRNRKNGGKLTTNKNRKMTKRGGWIPEDRGSMKGLYDFGITTRLGFSPKEPSASYYKGLSPNDLNSKMQEYIDAAFKISQTFFTTEEIPKETQFITDKEKEDFMILLIKFKRAYIAKKRLNSSTISDYQISAHDELAIAESTINDTEIQPSQYSPQSHQQRAFVMFFKTLLTKDLNFGSKPGSAFKTDEISKKCIYDPTKRYAYGRRSVISERDQFTECMESIFDECWKKIKQKISEILTYIPELTTHNLDPVFDQ